MKHQKDISGGKPKVKQERVEYDRQKNARKTCIYRATKNMSLAEARTFKEYIKLQHDIMKKCKSMVSLYNGDISGYHS